MTTNLFHLFTDPFLAYPYKKNRTLLHIDYVVYKYSYAHAHTRTSSIFLYTGADQKIWNGAGANVFF